MPPSPRRPGALVLVCLVAVLTACGSGADDGAGPREWRDLELVVPAGWTVLDERGDLLMLANEDIRVDFDADPTPPADPDGVDVVAVQLIADGSSTPDDWRALIAERGGEIEADERIEVGGLPATSIRFRWTTNDVTTRERVVFVPSRELYVLLQPVPVSGQTTGPDVYLRHTDEFEAILGSITFGRPFEG